MLKMIAYNLNRGSNDVRLFEAGHVYEADGWDAAEPRRLCLGATGNALPLNVNRPQERRGLTFFDLKGDVENLLSAFSAEKLHYDAEA
ncbi:MAG: phenylalanine--tRNA ligase subunit beta, partial [Acidobacteria bacterium]